MKIDKIINKLKKGQTIDVIWLDAFSSTNVGWKTSNDEIVKVMPISSLGRFWSVDAEYLMLVACLSIHPEVETIYSRELKIPLGCIKELHVMMRKERNKNVAARKNRSV
ncbi:MAG: hypothetical protein ACE14T_09220 [Syntrophales bacterium]